MTELHVFGGPATCINRAVLVIVQIYNFHQWIPVENNKNTIPTHFSNCQDQSDIEDIRIPEGDTDITPGLALI